MPEGDDSFDDGQDDWQDEWQFDEAFVRGAAITEGTAEERLERLRRINADHDRLRTQREIDLDAVTSVARRAYGRGPGARRRFTFSTFLIVATTIVIGIYAVKDGLFSDEGAQDFFFASDGPGADVVVGGGIEHEFPAPPADEVSLPLDLPPTVSGSGPHAFSWTQPDGVRPVAYDPCQPIHFVVNWATAPTDSARRLVDAAVTEVSAATGLQFVYDGSSPEIPRRDRPPVLDRYGDRWAPLLIAWTDPAEYPDLAGDVLGAAGSSWIESPDGARVYVSGLLALDGPELAAAAEELGDEAVVEATIMHELAHVVGLDHVDDESEIMNPYVVPGVDDFGEGDRVGLSALGRGECFPGV